MVNATPRPLYPRERDPVPIVQEAGWAPGPVRTGAENLSLTGIRSPDRPARSESLYLLSYRGPRRAPSTYRRLGEPQNRSGHFGEKSLRPAKNRSPDRPVRSPATIPTEVSRSVGTIPLVGHFTDTCVSRQNCTFHLPAEFRLQTPRA